jgi:hypothetical protein
MKALVKVFLLEDNPGDPRSMVDSPLDLLKLTCLYILDMIS